MEQPLQGNMFQGLASALNGLASWLQWASQTAPVSQLALIAWLVLVASCSFSANHPFNVSEQ